MADKGKVAVPAGGEKKTEGGRGGRGGEGAGRGFGRGDARGGRKRDTRGKGPRNELDEWTPVTKLGRLVKAGKIDTLEQIFRFSIPVKEAQIVDHFYKDKDLESKLKEEVMEIRPVQKQTRAGQRTRFKAYVVVGDGQGHVGLGGKVSKEVQGAIKGAITDAKLNLFPVRKGYYGNKIGKPHTVPCKVTGKGGSVRVRLIPAPRGTGIVGAPTPKKVLQFAGIQDCYTSSKGSTKTKGNTLKACIAALEQTYKFLSPDLWGKSTIDPLPFETYSKYLNKGDKNE